MKILSLLCLLSVTAFGLSGERLRTYMRYADKTIEMVQQHFTQCQYQKACCIIRRKKKELIEQNAKALSDALSGLANAAAMQECEEKYTIIDQKIDDVHSILKPNKVFAVFAVWSILNPSAGDKFGLMAFLRLTDIVDLDHPVIRKYVVESWREGEPVGPNW